MVLQEDRNYNQLGIQIGLDELARYRCFTMDPHNILGVDKYATLAQIRSQYRKKLRQCHPDKFPHDDDDLKQQRANEFHHLQQAYEALERRTPFHFFLHIYGEQTALDSLAAIPKARTKLRSSWGTDSGMYLAVRRQPAKTRTADSCPVWRAPCLKIGKATSTTEDRAHNKYASDKIGYVGESSVVKPNFVESWLAIQRRSNFKAALKAVHKPDDDSGDLQEIETNGMAMNYPNGESELSHTFCGLEGRINGIHVFALADTGSHMNFINGTYAKSLELKSMDYALDQRPQFVMGHGRTTHAVGEIEISWQFEGESDLSYGMVLQVLPNSIFDVMIGAKFLYETNTMAGNNHRLRRIPKPDRAMLARNVNFCGSPCRYLNGVLLGADLEPERCFALPDSGAEANILSYEFAKRRGWLTNLVLRSESERLLLFADGSTARSEGQLRLEWTFCHGWRTAPANTAHHLTFEVLSRCPVDAILGEDFLDDTDAFENHAKAFVDDFFKRTSSVATVVWANDISLLGPLKGKLKRKGKTENLRAQTSQGDGANTEDPTNLIYSELQRRAEADHKIFNARKDPVRKAAEARAEKTKRQIWDIDHSSK